MNGIDHLLLAISSFANVFLLGFQSKNVQHSRYWMAAFTSVGICLAQYFFARYAAHGEGWMFLAVSGPAGALGIVIAIKVHDLMLRERKPAAPTYPEPKLDAPHRRRLPTLVVAGCRESFNAFVAASIRENPGLSRRDFVELKRNGELDNIRGVRFGLVVYTHDGFTHPVLGDPLTMSAIRAQTAT